MKKTVLGMCVAGALTMGVAGGYGVAEHKNEQMNEQRLTMQLQRAGERMTQQLNAQRQMIAEQRKIAVAQRTTMAPEPHTISERFMITENDGDYVRGEKLGGNGEGIYYDVKYFERFDLEDVSVGNVVDVAWPEDSYNNENWDDVKRIAKIK